MFDLTGKSALVTGASGGIGGAIATSLHAAGANVGLSGTRVAPLEELAAKLGDRAFVLPCNLGDADAVKELPKQAIDAMGGLDILVNNAGIQHVAPIDQFPVDKWDAIIAINMSSNFHTTAMALPMMRKAGWGRVINIASAHGLTASPFKSAYVTAKHGVVGLTKVTALETAEERITANAICPGYVLTPLIEAQVPETMKEYGMDRETVIRDVILARQPSKEFSTIEQIAGITTFLCSETAAQITGTTISADGGWTAL